MKGFGSGWFGDNDTLGFWVRVWIRRGLGSVLGLWKRVGYQMGMKGFVRVVGIGFQLFFFFFFFFFTNKACV